MAGGAVSATGGAVALYGQACNLRRAADFHRVDHLYFIRLDSGFVIAFAWCCVFKNRMASAPVVPRYPISQLPPGGADKHQAQDKMLS